jgi:soluble lytic murein transglycosylase-like protein
LTNILTGIAKVESNFDPNAKAKKSTAAGMFQFTKATQKDYGVTNPYDAAQSAGAAAAYIDKLMQRYKGDKVKALAAYNQGPGVIDRGLNKAGREYAMKVLAASRNV